MPTKKKPLIKRAPSTPKEKAFAKEYILNGGNGTQAALKVYDVSGSINPNGTASVIATENLAKLSIVEMMDEMIGLRPKDRLKTLKQGLKAKKDTLSGESVADHATRYKFLDLSFKLDGSLKAGETIVQNNTQNNYQLNVYKPEKYADPDDAAGMAS